MTLLDTWRTLLHSRDIEESSGIVKEDVEARRSHLMQCDWLEPDLRVGLFAACHVALEAGFIVSQDYDCTVLEVFEVL